MALPPPSADSTALVTGASSGIGEEFARALAERGYGVTLVARSEDKLERLATELKEGHGVRVETIGCDLGDRDARERLPQEIERRGLTVEVLVNNAGFGIYTDFVESDRERELGMAELNVMAVLDLSTLFVPAMAERGRGAMIVTASTSAFQPIPGNAGYAASKAWALWFAEALHMEVRGKGVTVTALCPGPVKTGFQEVSGAESFTETLPKPLWEDAADVVEAALKGAEKGKRVVVPGVPNQVGGAMARYSPRAIVLRLLRSQTS